MEFIEDNIILNETETLISYYDRSMWMDASEVVILTTERVIYIKNNENSIVNINEIDDITHKNDDWGDDIILISYQGKLKLKIEISFDHNGDLFLKSLTDVWEDTKSQNQ